jgi:hypothetical protein
LWFQEVGAGGEPLLSQTPLITAPGGTPVTETLGSNENLAEADRIFAGRKPFSRPNRA